MASNISYKRVTSTTLKVCGILDADRCVIDVDGEELAIITLLSDFNGATIDFSVKAKEESSLDLPVDGSDNWDKDDDEV